MTVIGQTNLNVDVNLLRCNDVDNFLFIAS